VNLTYNVILVFVIQYGSAALLTLASALIIPAANFLFTLPAVAGAHAVPLNAADVLALFVILFGLCLYSSVIPPGFHAVTGGLGAMVLFVSTIPQRTVRALESGARVAAYPVQNYRTYFVAPIKRVGSFVRQPLRKLRGTTPASAAAPVAPAAPAATAGDDERKPLMAENERGGYGSTPSTGAGAATQS
jgi:hypothetical protein